ncbi:MAG: DUF3187 family protein [Deltaproteobacteria bacterium]|nr:DUF3187 family protein [Deltaproteobacteria bacterium]
MGKANVLGIGLLWLAVLFPGAGATGIAHGQQAAGFQGPIPPFAESNFCEANVGYGLLSLPSQSPFQSLRLAPMPRMPSTLKKGRTELSATATLANVWAYESGGYLVDYETLNTRIAFAYGILPSVLLEVAYDERRVFGGVLDSVIMNFHNAFGIDQDKRDQYPKDQVNIQIYDAAGTPLVTWQDDAVLTQSIAATLQHNLTCGDDLWPAFSWSATLRHDLRDAVVDQEDDFPDVGLSLSLSKRLGVTHVYLSPSMVFFGEDSVGTIKLRDSQISGLFGVEWRFVEKSVLLVQYLVTQGAVQNFGEYSEPSHEITLGLKVEVAPSAVVAVGLLENIVTYDNSPDFGVHAGLTARF